MAELVTGKMDTDAWDTLRAIRDLHELKSLSAAVRHLKKESERA